MKEALECIQRNGPERYDRGICSSTESLYGDCTYVYSVIKDLAKEWPFIYRKKQTCYPIEGEQRYNESLNKWKGIDGLRRNLFIRFMIYKLK